MSIEALLFGNGVDRAGDVIAALVAGARHGIGTARDTGRLAKIEVAADADNRWNQVDPSAAFGSAPTIDHRAPPCFDAACIQLLSPLRLQRQKQILDAESLTFRDFFVNIMRRVSTLVQCYEQTTIDLDFKGLAELAGQTRIMDRNLLWHDNHRYSARQRTLTPLGGIVGTFGLEGDLTPFRQLLWTGQCVGVGKATMFGHGQYRLSSRPDTDKLVGNEPAAHGVDHRLS